MNITIGENLHLTIYGFAGTAVNKDYVKTAFQLSDAMWRVVKDNKLDNKGKNIWVYEANDKVFAGVEVNGHHAELEEKQIHLPKYAYYKHIGPYSLIKQAGQQMTEEIKKLGLAIQSPYIEIYGHWTNDESKLETELIMCLK